MMKKILTIALVMLLMLSACAEGLPEGAVVLERTGALLRAEIPATGEIVALAYENGAPVSLMTETEGSAQGETDREAAERAVMEEYPGARILFSENDGEGRVLAMIGESLSGTFTVRGGQIVRRELVFGAYSDGEILTQSGAETALGLLRPGCSIVEIETDREDGLLIYEGEATLGGAEYEFELNARTGRLLEWERD